MSASDARNDRRPLEPTHCAVCRSHLKRGHEVHRGVVVLSGGGVIAFMACHACQLLLLRDQHAQDRLLNDASNSDAALLAGSHGGSA